MKRNTMKTNKAWFTISYTVPMGEGDYGSTNKTVFDGIATLADAEQKAQSTANLFRSMVCLFKGKTLGKLVATYDC